MKVVNLQLFAEDDDTVVDDTIVDEPKQFTQEDIDKMIQSRLAKAKKQAEEEKQKAINDALAKAAEKQQAEKLKDLSDAEKQAEELKLLKAELQELKLKDERATMGSEVRKQLAEKKLNVSDVIVGMLVAPDAETTNARIKDFTSLFQEAVDAAIKEKLKGKTPKDSTKKAALTREELEKKLEGIKDPIKRQALIRDNLELFT